MSGSACQRQIYEGFAADVDDRKTVDCSEIPATHGLERQRDGSFIITSFVLARQFLRSRVTLQGGFNADLVKLFPQKNTSILFLEGEEHRRRRSVVARFFAPITIKRRYRPAIEALSTKLVDELVATGHGTLDDMSLELSVGIASVIVGMTNSSKPGLGKRLSRFFEGDSCVESASWFAILRYILKTQIDLLRVYILDVRPAIKERRRAPREDLISHLIDKGWSHLDILKECVTYGTAGMSTTREFIVAAAWHLLERDALRARFLAARETERIAILGEILRLEPPVSTLYRKTAKPIVLEDDGQVSEIPEGARVAVDLRRVNTDPVGAGRCPFSLQPDRPRTGPVGAMSFGDGHHRCPGAAIAMEETAVFLERLLRLPSIRLARTPDVSRNKMSTGYVLRNAIVTV